MTKSNLEKKELVEFEWRIYYDISFNSENEQRVSLIKKVAQFEWRIYYHILFDYENDKQ